MNSLRRKSEHARQVPVDQGHGRRLQLADSDSAQAPTVNEAGMVDQRSGWRFQPGLLRRKCQMERGLRMRPSQRHNRDQWTPGGVVQISGNDHHRASRALLMAVDGIESAPEDLAPFNYHFSSGKSVADARSQTAISARWLACSSGSSALQAKAAVTSAQKTRASISSRARRITWAFDWPSLDASLESVPMASPVMRTLVATFSIVLFYYEQHYMLTHITVVTVRRRS